jgi:hypothetical protein
MSLQELSFHDRTNRIRLNNNYYSFNIYTVTPADLYHWLTSANQEYGSLLSQPIKDFDPEQLAASPLWTVPIGQRYGRILESAKDSSDVTYKRLTVIGILYQIWDGERSAEVQRVKDTVEILNNNYKLLIETKNIQTILHMIQLVDFEIICEGYDRPNAPFGDFKNFHLTTYNIDVSPARIEVVSTILNADVVYWQLLRMTLLDSITISFHNHSI